MDLVLGGALPGLHRCGRPCLGGPPPRPHCRAPAPSRSLLLLLASLPRGEGTVPCQGERSNSGLSEGQRIAPLSQHQSREQVLCPPAMCRFPSPRQPLLPKGGSQSLAGEGSPAVRRRSWSTGVVCSHRHSAAAGERPDLPLLLPVPRLPAAGSSSGWLCQRRDQPPSGRAGQPGGLPALGSE